MARAKRKPKQEPRITLATVQNPLWSPAQSETLNRFIQVPINPRESAVGGMVARKLLSESQALSATRFRQLWETLGGKGAGAIDYTKEPVDGGQIAEPINLQQIQAGFELKRCRELLGERGYKLVSQVCGEGYQISELVDGKRQQLSLMDHLRGFLDDLSVMWRYASSAQQTRFAVQK